MEKINYTTILDIKLWNRSLTYDFQMRMENAQADTHIQSMTHRHVCFFYRELSFSKRLSTFKTIEPNMELFVADTIC